MGDGTKENPYTREDVLRLIAEKGEKAEGLDLSGKVFEEDIDLRQVNLSGIILKKAVFLVNRVVVEPDKPRGAHLEVAFLRDAHLEGARLWDAHLKGADLWDAHLEGADLRGAHLEGAGLVSAKFSPETRLENVDWRNYILREEKDSEFDLAVDTYRQLKQWYTTAGIYDIAGKFFFREMTARRKALEWWPKPWNRAFSKLLSILCGYGEKPERVVVSAVGVIFGLALIYFFLGAFSPGTFAGCLYYSVVSFTALGYGSWVHPEPESWAKGVGAAEAAVGVFMMALFLVTFTRKMTR